MGSEKMDIELFLDMLVLTGFIEKEGDHITFTEKFRDRISEELIEIIFKEPLKLVDRRARVKLFVEACIEVLLKNFGQLKMEQLVEGVSLFGYLIGWNAIDEMLKKILASIDKENLLF